MNPIIDYHLCSFLLFLCFMADAVFNRLLALQHQTNHTVYDAKWNELRTWLKNPNTVDTMAGNAEVKYKDVFESFVVNTTAGAVANLSKVIQLNTAIAQGTGVSERIGNHIQATGLRLGILAYATSQRAVVTRVIVLRTPAVGTGTAYPVPVTDVLRIPEGAGSASIVLAPRNLETQKSSGQVLYDNTFTTSTMDADGVVRQIKTEIELDARVLFKNPDAGAITTNALSVYFLSTGLDGGDATSQVNVLTRFMYTDS